MGSVPFLRWLNYFDIKAWVELNIFDLQLYIAIMREFPWMNQSKCLNYLFVMLGVSTDFTWLRSMSYSHKTCAKNGFLLLWELRAGVQRGTLDRERRHIWNKAVIIFSKISLILGRNNLNNCIF